jgi:hypothetical protein
VPTIHHYSYSPLSTSLTRVVCQRHAERTVPVSIRSSCLPSALASAFNRTPKWTPPNRYQRTSLPLTPVAVPDATDPVFPSGSLRQGPRGRRWSHG